MTLPTTTTRRTLTVKAARNAVARAERAQMDAVNELAAAAVERSKIAGRILDGEAVSETETTASDRRVADAYNALGHARAALAIAQGDEMLAMLRSV